MTHTSVRNAARDGSGARLCPVCDQPLASGRAQYCSAACRQRAFRLRQAPAAPVPARMRAQLRQQRQLTASTVYECPECATRYLGQQRCDDCHTFCRALGLGGHCAECDAVLLLTDLLPLEVVG